MTERDSASPADRALERRSKQVFERGIAALDGATRARLTQARMRALEELPARRRAWLPASRFAAPAGAAAALALAAWLVAVRDGAAPEATLADSAVGDLDLLLGDEELELIEELDFYAWLEAQPEFVGGDGVG